jgi:hypothetical protein
MKGYLGGTVGKERHGLHLSDWLGQLCFGEISLFYWNLNFYAYILPYKLVTPQI